MRNLPGGRAGTRPEGDITPIAMLEDRQDRFVLAPASVAAHAPDEVKNWRSRRLELVLFPESPTTEDRYRAT